MKQKIYLLIVALILLIKFSTVAQSDYTTYQFLLEAGDKALTVKNGLLSFEEKKAGIGQYNQLFILKRTEAGNVLIVSAAEEELYLKRNSGTVALSSGDFDPDAEWEVNYTGDPFVTIAIPAAPMQVLTMQNSNLVVASFTKLSDNDDTSGNNSRLRIVEVTNTF
ncbi:MAG: hypothetical protein WBA74_18410 [Cyclobacteriaceae bacterium]